MTTWWSARRWSALTFLSIRRIDWPCLFQPLDTAPDVAANDRREPFRRLVENEQPGICHQRAADGKHLLLAARQRARELTGPFLEAWKQVIQPGQRPRTGLAQTIGCRRDQILAHGQCRKDHASLRNEADAKPRDRFGRTADEARAAEVSLAIPSGDEAEQGIDRGRLAHAVAAEQGDHLALGDVEIDTEQHLAWPIARPQAADAEHQAPSSPR